MENKVILQWLFRKSYFARVWQEGPNYTNAHKHTVRDEIGFVANNNYHIISNIIKYDIYIIIVENKGILYWLFRKSYFVGGAKS